ncbi:MAG: hypothetical protein V4436_00185 [Patescibacteria group bacterium]
MPFIAIAVMVALALGGGVTVAADQAKPGEALYSYKVHINDAVRHEYHSIKASLSGEAEVEGDVDAAGGIRLSGTEDNGQFDEDLDQSTSSLRIRADAEARALDDKINADGSLEVKIH